MTRRTTLASFVLLLLVSLTGYLTAQFPKSGSSAGSGGGSGTPGGSNKQVQFNDSSSFNGDAGLTYDKTTGTLSATILATGNGSTPSLLDYLCGTAPSSPSAGHVYGYCTSNVPLFKVPAGTVSMPVVGIANPSDSQCINYVGTDGVQNRISCGGSPTITDEISFMPARDRANTLNTFPGSYPSGITSDATIGGFPVSSFTNSGTPNFAFHFHISHTWTGNVDVKILWTENAGGGAANVVWNIYTAGATPGTTDITALSYNAAQSVTTAKPTDNTIATSEKTTVTTTGWAVDREAFIKIERPNTGSDTFAAPVYLLGVVVRISHT